MSKQTEGLADEWQRLVAEWEAAMAAHKTAVAGAAGGADVAAAEDRLAGIKQKMDAVVAAGKADRRSRARKDDLVARVIDLGDAERSAPGSPTRNDSGRDR